MLIPFWILDCRFWIGERLTGQAFWQFHKLHLQAKLVLVRSAKEQELNKMGDSVGAIPCDRSDMTGYPRGTHLQIDK